MSDSFRMLTAVLAAAGGVLASACGNAAAEPTEEEMRAAVERAFSGAGNGAGNAGEIRIDNPINGMTIGIRDFEKLGCVAAKNKPGFVCDYRVTTSMGFHSNEGTAAGDAHAKAVGDLMRMISGGRSEGMREAVTARFVQSKGEWIRLSE